MSFGWGVGMSAALGRVECLLEACPYLPDDRHHFAAREMEKCRIEGE